MGCLCWTGLDWTEPYQVKFPSVRRDDEKRHELKAVRFVLGCCLAMAKQLFAEGILVLELGWCIVAHISRGWKTAMGEMVC